MGMKTIGRDKVRGKRLDHDCYDAHTTRNEYGPNDNRVFCYGRYDQMNDEPLDKCRICAAFIQNETPPTIHKVQILTHGYNLK